MKEFKGQIKYLAQSTNTDAKVFRSEIQNVIETQCNDMYVEIQYQTCMSVDNQVVYSALVIGRASETIY